MIPTDWKRAYDDVVARLHAAEQERDELRDAIDACDSLFGWLQRNYPKALDEMPTSIYKRVRIAGLALAGENNPA